MMIPYSPFGRPQTTVVPPRTINVQKFAESRGPELETLHSIIKNRLQNDFRSQRSKRRRTTGHDNRATRNKHKKKRKVENKDVDRTHSLGNDKVAPRRVRRRIEFSKNLNGGFLTSGDGTKRLRTHIWHAKRFTMTKLWGFYLPLRLQGSGRGSRALLKKLKDRALVHDTSYCTVIQLEGLEEMVQSVLDNTMVSSSSNSEYASQYILSGLICCKAMLHRFGEPFSSPIAPIMYMWQPQNSCSINAKVTESTFKSLSGVDEIASSRRLWIFIHASAFGEGFEALQHACKQHMSANNLTVSCISLEDRLTKLEVIGSMALQVLKKTLHPANHESEFAKTLEEDQIPYYGISSLTVVDPRYFTEGGVSNSSDINVLEELTYKEQAMKQNAALVEHSEMECNSPSRQCSEFEESCDLSVCMDLWHLYKDVSPPIEERVLCAERHNQRMKLFGLGDRISGALDAPNIIQRPRSCPILLIKNYSQISSSKRWSIILPLSWVKVIWISLISNGAHAMGLAEKHWVACESGLPCFPYDFPDCKSYSWFMEMEEIAANEKAERIPPPLRPFRVPIQPPWNSVHLSIEKRSSSMERNFELQRQDLCTEDFEQKCLIDFTGYRGDRFTAIPFMGFIARTSRIFSQFLNQINGSHLLLFPKFINTEKCISKVIKENRENRNGVIFRVNYGPKLCFVRVLLHAYNKGVFEGGAVVCAPQVDELLLLTQRPENSEGQLQITESSVRSYFVQRADGKWECQLPTDPESIASHRLPIGFVTTGFIPGSKKPVAVALCEAINLACLREDQWRITSLKRRKEIYVLVRNLRSTTYRLALANIILEQREDDDLDYM
ncbi:unnamed protein product [Cuscuta epithymum]|uniref:Uncharacterized protein n=2 Tax=Cuscuta epithymum TaxID=186058 RepID=A0AAV0FE67_9ASTE|nr:unnamed protein product [Cuscuta epithymum]